MSNAVVVHKNGEVTEHKLQWNSEKKIYEVFPKVEDTDLYWNDRKQVKINY